MKSDPYCGDDRRAVNDAVTVNADIRNYFWGNKFWLLHHSMRSASYVSDFSRTRQRFENAQDRRYDGNEFSCLSTAYDWRSYRVAIYTAGFWTIVWKNFDRCRRMRFIPFDILWCKLLQMWF